MIFEQIQCFKAKTSHKSLSPNLCKMTITHIYAHSGKATDIKRSLPEARKKRDEE